VLSFQQGIQHSYYTSAMAPPIAALTGIGAVAFYQAYRRRSGWSSLLLPLAIAVTGAWSFLLLRRTPGWNPWLSFTVLGATVVAVLVLAFGWLRARRSDEDMRSAEGVGEQQSPVQADRGDRRFAAGRRKRLLTVAGVAGLIAVLAGPAAYAMTPLSRPIEGTNPVAGPAAGGTFGGAGIPADILRDFAGLADGARTGYGEAGGYGRTGAGPGSTGPAGGYGRDAGLGAAGLGGGAFRTGGGLGGSASKQLIAYLEAHRDGATWLVAVRGSDAAAAIILQTGGIPVMAMGGFSGSDPAPTVAQLEQYVKEGKLRYVLTGGRGGFGGGFGGGGGGGGGVVASVTSWVEQNCTAVPASAYGASTDGGSASPGGAGTLYHCG
jgi:4-amino-4-deoxy-L-arabinose transferase-like glycosyltransferase